MHAEVCIEKKTKPISRATKLCRTVRGSCQRHQNRPNFQDYWILPKAVEPHVTGSSALALAVAPSQQTNSYLTKARPIVRLGSLPSYRRKPWDIWQSSAAQIPIRTCHVLGQARRLPIWSLALKPPQFRARVKQAYLWRRQQVPM